MDGRGLPLVKLGVKGAAYYLYDFTLVHSTAPFPRRPWRLTISLAEPTMADDLYQLSLIYALRTLQESHPQALQA